MDTQIPCILDNGVVFHKRDIIRVLQSLDQVEYTEEIDGKEMLRRIGFIVEIFEDEQQATIFFNRRIHINVSSFEYLKIEYLTDISEEPPDPNKPDYRVELAMPGARKIILRPMSDPLDNPTTLIAEVEERRRAAVQWEEVVVAEDDD